jgi:hypothetical protein
MERPVFSTGFLLTEAAATAYRPGHEHRKWSHLKNLGQVKSRKSNVNRRKTDNKRPTLDKFCQL